VTTLDYRRLASHLAVRSRIAGKRWRRRMLFMCGGVAVGAAAVGMAMAADEAHHLFRAAVQTWPYLPLVVTPFGFVLAIWLSRNVFPNSQGSGIPQAIAALKLEDAEAAGRLVSLRVAIGKIIVMTLGLLTGASIGREGPTVQVGAAIMHAIGRFAPYRRSGFLLAGAAAGVAAAFNTPLAGIVFGIEEMSRSFEIRTSGLIIAAVIVAGLTSLALVGDYAYFGIIHAFLPLGRFWLVVPVCAGIGGLMGGLFGRVVLLFARGLPGRAGRWMSANPLVFAFLCGLGVALCGLVGHNAVFGTGYEEARAIIHGAGTVDASFGPLKFLASLISAISGIPGGIFAPSLAIGAGLGQDLTLIFQHVPIAALALIGMVSYLTGVVQAPITSFVIVSEMTNDHDMIIPLMASAVIANATSKLIAHEGLYHALARSFLPQRKKHADIANTTKD
jgi:H+/Cl- antiporter ClcA